MVKVITLTDEDAIILRLFLDRVKKNRFGSIKKDSERYFDEGDDHLTPEVWVGKPQAEIAARVTTTPGKGDADLFYIDDDDEVLKAYTNEDKEVYNMGTNALSATEYYPIWRTKGGEWFAFPGSQGTELIRFKILSVLDWTAVIQITSRPCGVTTVTGEADGQVTVKDPCHCFLDEPTADLLGRCGGAAYMDPSDQAAVTGTGTGTGVDPGCQWEIQWMCCPTC